MSAWCVKCLCGYIRWLLCPQCARALSLAGRRLAVATRGNIGNLRGALSSQWLCPQSESLDDSTSDQCNRSGGVGWSAFNNKEKKTSTQPNSLPRES
ncbi:hypothetical protein B0T09DRAFT_66319 [Sordaria sp. MPI-SDFR-AT-0083]|nr:hypothetical protein B0T09DRAFT_66319 [Sordaria sp. MPI-SDFR-AT-0083]